MINEYSKEANMSIAEIKDLYGKLLKQVSKINAECLDNGKVSVISYLEEEGIIEIYDTASFLRLATSNWEPQDLVSNLKKAQLNLDKSNVLAVDWAYDELQMYEGDYREIYNQLLDHKELEFYLLQLTINEVETMLNDLDGTVSQDCDISDTDTNTDIDIAF